MAIIEDDVVLTMELTLALRNGGQVSMNLPNYLLPWKSDWEPDCEFGWERGRVICVEGDESRGEGGRGQVRN